MDSWDVVIVGSGYGGSVTAARLAEGGMRVLLLERGRRFRPGEFRQSDDLKVISSVVDVVVSSRNIAYRTGKMVGGASIPMDGAHFRVPSRSFDAVDAAGRRYWPEALDRAALDPYYARVEEMLQVRQLRWDEISKAGGLFGRVFASAGASAERARLNYRDCRQCGFCAQGCIYQKKVTMLHSYLPLAETYETVIEPDAAVDHIEPDGAAYRVFYRRDGEDRDAQATRVVVAGGGIHSAALLLRSRPWLTRLSPHVGENFNNNGEHPFLAILPPDYPGVDDYWCYMGMDNAGLMSFHWFESEGITFHPGGGFEPSAFAAGLAATDHPVLPSRAWGLEYKRFVEQIYPHRLIGFSANGLSPGNSAITVRGDGQPDIQLRDSTGLFAYLDRLERIVEEIAEAAGVTIVTTSPREYAGTTSTHLLSANRMADDASDGVIDADCSVWGHENLYVCDASSIPFSVAVNPSLTIAALAERASERILARG